MNLLSAFCCLPEQLSQPDSRPYGYARPMAAAGSVGIDILEGAVHRALEDADCRAQDIDLIVSLSWSPDHMVDDPAIMGPRIGHPLQKRIGATSAFVFDMMDASLAKTLHIINHFALMQSMKRVLVVRMDIGQGLRADETSGFRIPDGAFALVLSPDHSAEFQQQKISGTYTSLTVDLNTDIRNELDVKGRYTFPYQASLVRSIEDTYRAFTQLGGTDRHHLHEQWFSEISSDETCLGPFTLPHELNSERNFSDSYLIVSFDPYSLSVEATTLSRNEVSE